ncbi:flavin reductase family protein [Nocardioides marmotae]|uniref:flavin reductase family protein n=1 Tax=Nocardioides marmotae TaxID=2663857 RepID=UPI0012B5998B|nr:flavin reductase family protein [Nocardioides marmotae]MBC9732433.1 flavin reductase family protein [Nocardioides marmotae]MTB83553.1 flavin reductase [Nocardioides marmotae]
MTKMSSLDAGSTELRAAFGCFPSGVTAVCALVDGEPIGMAASSFTSVSLDPPLVSVCIQNSSRTWRRLRSLRRMGVSVMSSGQDLVCRQLARREGDRFDGVGWQHEEDGAVFVAGAAARLSCGIHTVVPAGDHAIALLRVHELWFDPEVEPLVFHGSRFRTLAAS